MKKKLKTMVILCSILALSLTLSACTSGDDKKPEPTGTPQVEQSAVPSLTPATMTPTPSIAPSATPVETQHIMENEAFRILEPLANAEVGTTFTVKGQARVFEGVFSYSFEDGHKVLAEGNEQVSAGAPEWVDFELVVTFEKPTNPVGALILFEKSAKDGASTNQLMIPLKFEAGLLEPVDAIE